LRSAALAAAVGLSSSISFAQLLPPDNAYQWWNGSSNSNWNNGGNWVDYDPPYQPYHDVYFGSLPSATEARVSAIPTITLRSLWFDASVAYTLSPSSSNTILTLSGYGPSDGPKRVIYVSKGSATTQYWGAETNINLRINLTSTPASGFFDSPSRFRIIENQSEGGLGVQEVSLGIASGTGNGAYRLHVSGAHATRIQRFSPYANTSSLFTAGVIFVRPGLADQPTHLVMAGNNASWGGQFIVESQGFGVVKHAYAFGSGILHAAESGGTFGWRSHQGALGTDSSGSVTRAYGHGIVRQNGIASVGAIYNDGGINTHSGSIELHTLSGGFLDIWFGSRGDINGGLTLSGRIHNFNSNSFVKVGPGLITISNPQTASDLRNNWTRTEIRGGVLRVGHNNALPGVNVWFTGGILELGSGDFSRGLGVASGQVRWQGNGGFSAYGGARTVTLTNAQNQPITLTWLSGGFVPNSSALLLSSRYADNVITLANPINLGTSANLREIRVERALSTNAYAKISGALTGHGGLHKTGHGLLHLTDTNIYSGRTIIEGGALRGNINRGSVIGINGGVFALDGDFTRSLGSWGNNLVYWTGSGGFAAFGDDRTVRLGNSTTAITWGASNFVAYGRELRFGHYLADSTVIWDKGLNLGSGSVTAPRTIYLERGLGTNANVATVIFNQALSGNAATLNIRGDGRMDLNKASTSATIGVLNLYGAELRLFENAKLSSSLNTVALQNGGTLYIKNTFENTQSSRTGSQADLLFNAGRLTFDSEFLEGDVHFETFKDIRILGGANTIDSSSRAISVFGVGDKLVRNAASRGTMTFETNPDNQQEYLFLFEVDPSSHLRGGIIPWAVMGSTDFITTSEFGNGNTINANYMVHPVGANSQGSYYTGPQNTWNQTHNVKTASGGTITLSGNRTINSLILNQNLNLNGRALRINSGGLLLRDSPITISSLTSSGILGLNFTPGSLLRAMPPMYIHNSNTLTFSQSARISWGHDVVKTGGGALVFNGWSNDIQHFVLNLYIHQGTVDLKSGSILLISSNPRIYIGDGAGTDVLVLPGNVRNPLVTANPNIFPSITLHGTPHDPRGPEYGGDQAILRMGGNTKQHLKNLHIQDRGTIDWAGGEVSQANYLYLDTLTFSGPDAILFMRNWYEYEDYLLVRANEATGETGFDVSYLQNVRFEGYEDFPVIYRKYDKDYYQITPFGPNGASHFPEPTTTGAILGAVGIGLVAWRRRRKTGK